mgnify:CR=1 FL=1
MGRARLHVGAVFRARQPVDDNELMVIAGATMTALIDGEGDRRGAGAYAPALIGYADRQREITEG